MINILHRHQLEDYILSYTPEEQRQARELWKKYTARPEVIDFRNYAYNPKTLRYTDVRRQRKIPDSQMSVDALRFANGIRDEMRAFTTQAIKGQMDSEDWYKEMIRTMKLSYHATVDVGNGGQTLTDTQKRVMTGIVLLYFTRLNNLAQGINSGVTPFTEAILSRVGMYGLNNKSVWENWRYEAARALGYAEARRIPGPSEHCKNSATRPGCDELIQRGWMPIATMPALGQTTCLCITTPESKVLTPNGMIALNNVSVGDYVLTHKLRWRRVLSKIVKFSKPYHKQIYIQAPNGEKIGATDNHLWFTENGWQDAKYIYNNNSMVYNINIQENLYEAMFEVSSTISEQNQRRLSSKMPPPLFMQMRERERYTSKGMQELWNEQESKEAMGYSKSGIENEKGFVNSRSIASENFLRFEMGKQMGFENRRTLFSSLLGEWTQEVYIPLSMELDCEQRKNPNWLSYSSQEPQSIRRQNRKFRVDGITQARSFTRGDQSQQLKEETDFYMRELQKGIQEIQTQGQTATILFDKMPLGTPLYDIEVEEDHSFCLEGLFAHNSNCQCRMEFRDQSLAIYAGLEAVTNAKNSFINVYNQEGRLLFKFSPSTMKVQIKQSWMNAPVLVDLNQYRNGPR